MPTATPTYMRDYSYDASLALAGLQDDDTVIRAYANSGKVAQIGTILVDTATNSATYTWVLNGVTETYTADSSTSKIEIAAGIAAAINADLNVSGDVRAVSDGVDTVTITSRIPGLAFTLTDADAKITSTQATTANSDSARIPFGYGLLTPSARTVALPSGTLTSAVSAVAQVTHATPTAVNSQEYFLGVRMTGGASAGEIYMSNFTATGGTSVQEIVEGIVAAFNAQAPASTVVATEDDTKVILTAEVAGAGFEVLVGNETTAVWTIAESTANVEAALASGALAYDFAGVAVKSDIADENFSHIPGSTADGVSYPADSVVSVAQGKGVWVRLASDMSALAITDPVFLTYSDSGTGSAGEFRNDYDSGYAVALAGCRWVEPATTDPNGNLLAKLYIEHRIG